MKRFSSKEIETYVEGLEPDQQKTLMEIREAVLNAGDEVKEGIKWGSIAFFNKKNICGYRVAKKHITLLFMEGAMLNDKGQILAGDGAKARTYKVNLGDKVNGEAITELVKQSLAKGN